MHILYIDNSGSIDNANERFFVLGAVAVFERGLYHQIKAADDCVRTFELGDPHDIELHGSEMYSGRDGIWRSVRDRSHRETMIKRALATLGPGNRSIRLFAIIVDKQAVSPRDPIFVVFEEICNRFNLFLTRTNDRKDDNQRGLIVMHESRHESLCRCSLGDFALTVLGGDILGTWQRSLFL